MKRYKKKEERKRCNINIRVTEKDFNTIKSNADNMNMSVSDYVRSCLLKEDNYKDSKPVADIEYLRDNEKILIKHIKDKGVVVESVDIL
jgi:hypothetical protein